MELSPRKQAVLAAIIRTYIETGEPVGSKVLTGLIDNAPSSATLRNEMSELCELGLLEQPHTSAGRVPTSNGFKFYVDSLMQPVHITASAKNFIDSRLSDIYCDPEQIPALAGKILSDLTGLPAITCYVAEKAAEIRKTELIPVSNRSAMLLLITSDGRARSRIFRLGSSFTTELYERFREICCEAINGRPVTELTKAYMQSVAASAGIDSFILMPLFTAVFEMAGEIESRSVNLSGESCLYNICADEDTARRILSLVKRRDPILMMINDIPEGVGVVFGSDTGYKELKTDTVIAAKFGDNKNYRGAIGVIAPNRSSYEQVMPSIEYISRRLTDIMSDALKDMEE